MSLSNGSRRLFEAFIGRKKRFVEINDLSTEERSFRSIWRYVKYTSSVRFPPDRKRPNLLVFQMGKVASLAIHQALNECHINAFHCHTLSLGRQERALTSLFSSPLTFSLTSHELRLHVHNVSLRMLVRWYEAHKL